MKKESSIKRWAFYFSIAAAAIVVYKLLDNFTGIASWIGALIKVLSPFVGGILIAYILYIPSKKIEEAFLKHKNKKFLCKHARTLGVAITYLIAAMIIVIIINCIIPILIQSFNDLITNIPGYYQMAVSKINELPEDHFLRGEMISNIINEAGNIDLQSYFSLERITQYVKGAISVVNGIFDVFISIIVSVYILCQRKGLIEFWGKFAHALFGKEKFNKINKYFRNGNEIFFKFLSSQIIDALIVGILVSIAMLIIGVKYAVLLGFMIGLFNLIPYFGAIVAVGIAIIVTLLTGGIGQVVIMAIVVIALQQIDANIINPKVIGNSLKISQLVVIFAVTIGGAYFGVLGMFLAVPIVAIIKMIIEDFVTERNKEISKMY